MVVGRMVCPADTGLNLIFPGRPTGCAELYYSIVVHCQYWPVLNFLVSCLKKSRVHTYTRKIIVIKI